MRRYPEYKEGGVEFIGDIPKHWVAKKLRYFCSMKSGNGFSHDLQGRTGLEIPFFKVADTNTPENKVEMLYAQNTVSLEEVSDFKFILHKPNSIVFPKVGAALLLNKRNILTQKSCIDNNMMSLYSNQSNHKFLYYAMLNVNFKRHYRLGATVPSINESEVGNIPIAYPTHSEQTQIANFLDRKIQQIDELIRIKERPIELLHEQRTALINQAVTRGLDPNVEMKPSGVEWIGEIPAHWEVKQIKQIARFIGGYSEFGSESYTDRGIPIFRIGDVAQCIKMEQVKRVLTQQVKRLKHNELCHGDTLIVMIGRRAGESTYYAFDYPSILSTQVAGLRATEADSKFLFYFIHSASFLNAITPLFFGATRDNISKTALMRVKIPFPPNREQAQIVDFLDHKTGQIDELIAIEQRKIELLKEYRQSLISEVVTGKMDVRSEV